MEREVDVAIIGAGAAGIAAARRLRDRGQARAGDRGDGPRRRAGAHGAGGRACARSGLRLASFGRTQSAGGAGGGGGRGGGSIAGGVGRRQLRNLGFDVADQRAAEAAFVELEEGLHRNPPPGDVAGAGIAHDHPWRGYLDMISGALNGAELDRVSAADMLAYDEHASELNWRLPGGYGTLIAGLAEALPIAFATRVTAIDHGGRRVSIETGRGRVEAEAAIVAVPTRCAGAGRHRVCAGGGGSSPRCRLPALGAGGKSSSCRSPTGKRSRRKRICSAIRAAPRPEAIICGRSGGR